MNRFYMCLICGTILSIGSPIIGLIYYPEFKPNMGISNLLFGVFIGVFLLGISTGIELEHKKEV